MWERERKYKEEIATYHDKQRHTKEIVLEVGDQVLRPTIQPRASHSSEETRLYSNSKNSRRKICYSGSQQVQEDHETLHILQRNQESTRR